MVNSFTTAVLSLMIKWHTQNGMGSKQLFLEHTPDAWVHRELKIRFIIYKMRGFIEARQLSKNVISLKKLKTIALEM